MANPPLVGSDRKSGWGAIPGPLRRVRFISPLCSPVHDECEVRAHIFIINCLCCIPQRVLEWRIPGEDTV